ncbi:MAG: hypothetical protein E7672_07415 [Ruminococcaceae bacterium]|nr:hypothetical protein [Oscillospiraceae bacterium]
MRSYISQNIQIEQYVYRTELHAHTKPASHCSDIVPERLVEAYAALEYDTVVLTNHIRPNYTLDDCLQHIQDYRKAVTAAQDYGMTILFGVELTFSDLWGDYLVYGVEPSDMTALHRYCQEGYKSFAESPERKKSIVFTAHPYRNDRIGEELHIPYLSDGVESINLHPRVNSDNGYMTRTAWNQNLLTICGTDYHHEGHEGMTAILTTENPKNEIHLRDILRSGDYLMEMNGNIILPSHRMQKQQ